MRKLKIGVIGVGNMGSFHAGALAQGSIENATLGALCDTKEKRRASLVERYPDVPLYSDYRSMLEEAELDAVIVSVPHYQHCEITVACLEKGLHVICEKPEAVSVTKAQMMNDAAKKSSKVYSLMFNQRTDPIYAKAKELVEAGVLGQRKRLTWIITNWYRTQAYYDSGQWRATWRGEGGGVLLNQAPHNLDLWQWIFGMPETVNACCSVGKYHNIEVEDDVRIFATYADGASAEFITSTGEFPGTNRLEMVGDQAKIVIEDGRLKLWRLETPERQFCFESEKGFAEIPMSYEEFSSDEAPEGHIAIINNFVGAILRGEKLIAPGCEGINELTISNAAYLSAWKNETVRLPFDSGEYDEYLARKVETSKIKNVGDPGVSDAKDRWKVRW